METIEGNECACTIRIRVLTTEKDTFFLINCMKKINKKKKTQKKPTKQLPILCQSDRDPGRTSAINEFAKRINEEYSIEKVTKTTENRIKKDIVETPLCNYFCSAMT